MKGGRTIALDDQAAGDFASSFRQNKRRGDGRKGERAGGASSEKTNSIKRQQRRSVRNAVTSSIALSIKRRRGGEASGERQRRWRAPQLLRAYQALLSHRSFSERREIIAVAPHLLYSVGMAVKQ